MLERQIDFSVPTGRINALIHRQLQKDGKVSLADHEMMVYVNRQDMTGTERTFANSYVPDEDTSDITV